jgi:uncharacterized protein (DUF433 family)
MKVDFVQETSLLGVGLYTAPEVARLLTYEVGVPLTSKKVRRWAKGYTYKNGDVIREATPIVGLRLTDSGHDLFTFAEMIELLVIGAFRNEGVSSAMIRDARNVAAQTFGTNPFARRKFETNGRELFVTLGRDEVGNELSQEDFILEITRGQGAFDTVLRPLFRKIDFIDDIAERLWPLDRNHTVVIDPQRAFGRAIDDTSGVPTATLYGMHKAGESNAVIADWYRVSLQSVEDALAYEAALSNAA